MLKRLERCWHDIMGCWILEDKHDMVMQTIFLNEMSGFRLKKDYN